MRAILCGLVLSAACYVVVVCGGGKTFADGEGASFAHRAGLADVMDKNPHLVIDELELVLTQAQADALEAALLPRLSDEEMMWKLERVRMELRSFGLPEDDSVVAAVSTRIGTLRLLVEGAAR